MSKIAPEIQKKWDVISTKKYADQCKWMLNGFWDKLGKDAEDIWKWCQTFSELDPEAKAEGHELDEFWSHKFLETLGETMTVIEMREKFRKIDADFNKKMSIIEYIMYRYNITPEQAANAPQGENKEGIARAQKMVDEAQKAVDDMNVKLEESKKAAAAAAAAADNANKAAAAAKETADKAAAAAEAAKAAEEENKKALDELHAQEKAYEDKKAELTKTKTDMSIGVVKRNRAANELDQLLSEDPLPLRKAKITQAATVKKSEKAAAAAQAAKEKADADAAAAQAAAEEAERARADAEAAEQAVAAAVAEAEKKFQEALDFLEAEKMKGGIAQGDIWWMEREITEKKKYLPKSRR